jgi:gluconokinase
MGVSGSGKSTIGAALFQRLGWPFGQHRQDEERRASQRRRPLAVARRPCALDRRTLCGGQAGIVSCLALKRAYCSRIVGGRQGVRLAYLRGDMGLIARRLQARKDHFMPASLLESQFAALEEPGADERPLVVSIAGSPQRVVDTIIERLRLVSQSA